MKTYIKQMATKSINHSTFQPVSRLFSPFFSGIGSIVMFHRVVPSEKDIVFNELEVTAAYLEKTISYFIEQKYEIVSLDRAYEIVSGKQFPAKKFVVFTFDDGYEDNYSVAFPIFKKYNVPFTIYVTTCFPDKTAVIWWYALIELIESRPIIKFYNDGELQTYVVQTEEQKKRIYKELRRMILDLDVAHRHPLFQSLFNENGINIDELSSKLTMDWSQVKELSSHHLVTIGAHTSNHYNLKNLDAAAVKKEMLESKKRIESFLGTAVEHFAYPFGSAEEACEKEFQIAEEIGFKTSTTTRCGNIFSDHSRFLNCLPRITPSPDFSSVFPQYYMSGFFPAVKQGFKRIVTQ